MLPLHTESMTPHVIAERAAALSLRAVVVPDAREGLVARVTHPNGWEYLLRGEADLDALVTELRGVTT